MHPQAHQFPNQLTTFKDTLGKGSISVREFNLIVDEQGFIEGPASLAAEIAPHGFVPMARPAPAPVKQPMFGGKK